MRDSSAANAGQCLPKSDQLVRFLPKGLLCYLGSLPDCVVIASCLNHSSVAESLRGRDIPVQSITLIGSDSACCEQRKYQRSHHAAQKQSRSNSEQLETIAHTLMKIEMLVWIGGGCLCGAKCAAPAESSAKALTKLPPLISGAALSDAVLELQSQKSLPQDMV
jgi:hypothetical protein